MTTGGEKIRELRKAKGLTLRDLAEKLGIDFTYLSKIENMTPDDKGNPTVPSDRLLASIANTLGIAVDDLRECYQKPPTQVQDWARKKAFQEFRRSSSDRDITEDEWEALADHLRRLRSKKSHEGESK